MLNSPTPFPFVGSFALFIDPAANAPQAAELVRIQYRRFDRSSGRARSVIAFPLRDGASGNMEVDEADLIDATPLSNEELREFHELDLALHGRTVRTRLQKDRRNRRDLLRQRVIYAPKLSDLLRRMRVEEQRQRAGRRAA